MQKALLIAEKPTLMRKIESVYKANKNSIPYEITFLSQRGHLMRLVYPEDLSEDLKTWTWDTLPIDPEEYGGWKYSVIKDAKKGNYMTSQDRYTEIQKAIRSGDYDFLIHAGDPDQEGELLVNIVLRACKNELPVKRFWTNDLTDSHVLNALQNLMDDDHDPMLTHLMDAAYARQHSDWRVGMNISRAASLKMNARISCGRVKTPLLAIVCRREEEIRNFKPKTVYGVKAVYEEGFDGTLFDVQQINKDENAEADQKQGIVWFETKQEAEDVIAQLQGQPATVVQFDAKRTETYAPKLYKLATLQIEAGKRGYSDDKALEALQSLYEKEYISYPRTDCEYLSSDEDFDGILKTLSGLTDYKSYVDSIDASVIGKVRKTKKWINDAALKESGHSALRPTTKLPKLTELSDAERDIYEMIVRRFIAMFLPPLVQDKTGLVAQIRDRLFRSNGKTLVDPGFSVIFGTKFTDTVIPAHTKDDVLAVSALEGTEKTTTCPKRYTSPDLIAVCENPLKFLDDVSLRALGKKLKIGTPATRSNIIRQLIDDDHYLEEMKEKKTVYLKPTPIGEGIIRNLSDLQICQVDMTGLWEERLDMIKAGTLELPAMEEEMKASVAAMVQEIKTRDMNNLGKRKDRKIVGKCPRCGRDVIEGAKGFYCLGYKDGCKIGVFKESFGLKFDVDDFMTLAGGEDIEKNGRHFYYDEVNEKMAERMSESAVPCPCCPKQLQETDTRYKCGCGFFTMKTIAGHKLTKEDLQAIGENGHTDLIEDFVSKAGKAFSATLALKNRKLEFVFDNSKKRGSGGGSGKETDLTCPCCGKAKLSEREKSYFCKCGFTLWKTIAGHTLTEQDVTELCKEQQTGLIEDFKSKKGKTFSAYLMVDKDEKGVRFEFS